MFVLCASAHKARVVVDPPELELLALLKAASQRDWGAKFWKSRKCFLTTDFSLHPSKRILGILCFTLNENLGIDNCFLRYLTNLASLTKLGFVLH